MRTTLIEVDGQAHSVALAGYTRDDDYTQFDFVHLDTPEFWTGQIVELITTNDAFRTETFYIRCLNAEPESSSWQVISDSQDKFEWLEDCYKQEILGEEDE